MNPNNFSDAPFTSGNVPISPEVGLGIAAGFFGIIFLICLVIYIFAAICLMKIAKKTNTPNAWFAWVPILNIILMVQIVKQPGWWVVLFFVPIVNIVMLILVWMKIAEILGKPNWLGILMFISPVNLVVIGYLAFSNSAVVTATTQTVAPPQTPQAPVQPLQ